MIPRLLEANRRVQLDLGLVQIEIPKRDAFTMSADSPLSRQSQPTEQLPILGKHGMPLPEIDQAPDRVAGPKLGPIGLPDILRREAVPVVAVVAP